MSNADIFPASGSAWKPSEKLLFRFFFVFFLIQIFPFPWNVAFYENLLSVNWPHPHFKQLLDVIRSEPSFFRAGTLALYGIGSLANWAVFALIAAVATIVWSVLEKQSKDYTNLYYWLRVILRYKLGISLIALGIYKVFQLQMPFPSISNLHTNYGDYLAWKIYYQTVGITPEYETLLGLFEVAAGLLLFYRPTVTFGAGLAAGFLANIVAVNWFYDIGDLSFSAFLILIAIFLLAYDVPRLYTLLVAQKKAQASRFKTPVLSLQVGRLRYAGQVSFILVVLILSYTAYSSAIADPFKIPAGPTLPVAKGFYNVRLYVHNNDTIPYSLTDSVRWQNVVIESWPTLSIKINKKINLDLSNGDTQSKRNIDRDYELAGLGGRHYYDYVPDTLNKTVSLTNKNKNHRSEQFVFNYKKLNDTTLVLSGVNEKKDTIQVILDRIEKRYLMQEGLRKPVKL